VDLAVADDNTMHFVAFYRNDGDIRTQALQLIYTAINGGMDLGVTPLTLPAVRTIPTWPDMRTLANLPLTTQCEWLEYQEGKLTTLRLLVIDVEVVSVKLCEN
jgi:hypothetical protein